MSVHTSKRTILVCWVPGKSLIVDTGLPDHSAAVAVLRCGDVPPLQFILRTLPVLQAIVRQKDTTSTVNPPKLTCSFMFSLDRPYECYTLIHFKWSTATMRKVHTCPYIYTYVCRYFQNARNKHFTELYTHIPIHPSLFISNQYLYLAVKVF